MLEEEYVAVLFLGECLEEEKVKREEKRKLALSKRKTVTRKQAL